MKLIICVQILLEDDRVNLDIQDEDGNTLENILSHRLAPHQIATAKKLFRDARARRDGMLIRNKTVVFVINTDYSHDYTSLEGPMHDLEIAKKVFQAKGYSVHVIKNSDDIVEDVLSKMEAENMKETTDIFQLVYSGHGIHKISVEKGISRGAIRTQGKNENYYNQKGELGDCMVGTKGTLFEELFLSWQVSEELKKDASMCFFYDMCRNEEKVHIY